MSLKIEELPVLKPNMGLLTELAAGTFFCYGVGEGAVYMKVAGSASNAINIKTGFLETKLGAKDVYILKAKLTVECVMK